MKIFELRLNGIFFKALHYKLCNQNGIHSFLILITNFEHMLKKYFQKIYNMASAFKSVIFFIILEPCTAEHLFSAKGLIISIIFQEHIDRLHEHNYVIKIIFYCIVVTNFDFHRNLN